MSLKMHLIWQKLNNPEQRNIDTKSPCPQYKNKEERRVIEGSEQKVALKLGEIKEGQVTRKDHLGVGYKTESPITNKPKS